MAIGNISIAKFKQTFGIKTGSIDDDFIVNEITVDNQIENIFVYPCRLDAIGLVLCTKGEVKVTINLQEYIISEGMMIMNTPQNIIQVSDVGNVETQVFAISSRFMNEINVKNLMPSVLLLQRQPCIRLSVEEIIDINNFFKLVCKLANTTSGYRTEIIKGLITSLTYWVADTILSHNKEMESLDIQLTTRQELFYQQFLELLNIHHRTERSVSFYAYKLHLTPKYLSTIIKNISGRTAAAWIEDYVILEAKTLLKFSDMSIQEIAYSLNFTTQSFFGRYFKQHVHLSPKAYRNNN